MVVVPEIQFNFGTLRKTEYMANVLIHDLQNCEENRLYLFPRENTLERGTRGWGVRENRGARERRGERAREIKGQTREGCELEIQVQKEQILHNEGNEYQHISYCRMNLPFYF